MSSPVRVLLCDDHQLIRASLKSLMAGFADVTIVGEAENGHDVLRFVADLKPNVVVMDIAMPGLNGVEATVQLTKKHPEVRIIMLSMHSDERHVLQALRAGAVAYVLKNSAPNELEMAIQAALRGEIFLSPVISKHVIDVLLKQPDAQTSALDLLTPRQREILQLIAEGKSTKQIAHILDASVKTIESHRASLMERLDIHEIAGLVRFAIRNGLVSPDS